MRPGQRLLDLATGTGLVALPAAAAVGTIGFVAAVDISQAMLDQAQSKYTASRQLQDHPQQQQGLAPVQFIHGNIEQLDSCLPDDWQGSFDAITCSAAVPFLQDPAAAFQQWRYWLKPHSGRLVFNAFVAPAVEDFGTFVKLARQYGLPHETDPCENLGSVELVSAVLQNAGYLNVEVRGIIVIVQEASSSLCCCLGFHCLACSPLRVSPLISIHGISQCQVHSVLSFKSIVCCGCRWQLKRLDQRILALTGSTCGCVAFDTK